MSSSRGKNRSASDKIRSRALGSRLFQQNFRIYIEHGIAGK